MKKKYSMSFKLMTVLFCVPWYFIAMYGEHRIWTKSKAGKKTGEKFSYQGYTDKYWGSVWEVITK